MRRPAILETYSGLDRSIYFLFIARVINSMGNFIFPFLTLFLTQKLGFGEAGSGRYLLVMGMSFVPGSFLGGKLADHAGRKRILILFQLASALCVLPCAFLGSSPLIPWLLILASFFFGAVAPINAAMVTDLTPPEKRKAAFSFLYLGQNLGFGLGPVIAGFLFNRHMEWIFLGDAATTLLSLLFILAFVRESKPSPEARERSYREDASPERAERGPLIRVLFQRPYLLLFLIIQVFFSFVYSQIDFSLPIQLARLFGQEGPQRFGFLMSTNALVVIFLTTPVIHLTMRVKPILSVSLAGVFFAVGFGMIYFIRSLPLFILSTVVWTLGEVLAATNSGVHIASRTPMSHRGRFNSIVPILMGAGRAVSPPLIGAFIERFSVLAVWPVAFVLAALGAAMLLLLYFQENRPKVPGGG